MDELQEIFNKLDKNRNGSLSKEELIEGYRSIHGDKFNEKEIQALIDMADADGSGEIIYSEWLMTVVSREKIMTKEKLESIFKLFDKDKSSTISVVEIEEMIGAAREMDREQIK